MSEVFNKIKKIIKAELNIDDANLEADTNLYNDLKADNLDMVTLLNSVEKEFNIQIKNKESGQLNTVGSVVSMVKKKIF